MQRFFVRVGFAMFVLCLGASQPFSLARPVSASSAAFQGHAEKTVPFKGSLDGSVTLAPLAPPVFSVEINATGNATHLGAFTLAMPHTVNFETADATGTMTFTAANGDLLTAEFTGHATPGAIISIVEQGTITGGTGRFANATGDFTMNRQYDPVANTTTGSIEGSISMN